jgi:uncharacterized protein YqgC (DUF456 family)
VLLGSSTFPHDSFLNAGILEWGFRSIWSPHLRFFDWTAGFPLANSLAVGENLIGWQIVYTPIRSLGVGIPAAYNVLILLSLVVSGVASAMLARRLGANRPGAALTGIIFGFGPFHLSHMLHIQTMGVCWTPFAILFLDRYLESRAPRDAIGLALSFIISALSAVYFAVFLGIVLPLYAVLCWIVGRHRFNVPAFAGLLATGLFSVAVLMPLIAHYLSFNAQFGYFHDIQTLANFSLELTAPLRVPSWLSAWSWSPLVRQVNWRSSLSYTPAFPGVIALLLALYAISRGRATRESRAVIWLLVSVIAICYLLALGPLLRPINSNVPSFAWKLPMPGRIWMFVPGIRWPMRIFFISWLGGAVLAGLGLTFLLDRVGPRRRTMIAAGIILLLAIELRPASSLAGESAGAPANPMSLSDAYPFLAVERDRGGVIELPVSDPSGWRTPYSTHYIYADAGHSRRIVALHGSVTPPVVDTLLRAAGELPSAAAMTLLADHGVTRVVIHRSLMPHDSGAALIDDLTRAGYPAVFAGREATVFGTTLSPIQSGTK